MFSTLHHSLLNSSRIGAHRALLCSLFSEYFFFLISGSCRLEDFLNDFLIRLNNAKEAIFFFSLPPL